MELILMTYTDLYTKYKRWETRCHSAATSYDLDNATLLLSYDAGRTSSTMSDIAVYAIAVHTDHVHVFVFAVRTTWARDEDGEAEAEMAEEYRLIVSF